MHGEVFTTKEIRVEAGMEQATRVVSVRLDARQAELLASAAESAGKSLSTWMRGALVEAANRPREVAKAPPEIDPVLCELVGVGMLLAKMSGFLAGNKGVPPEYFQEVLRDIDARKRLKAKEVLSGYFVERAGTVR